MDNNTMKILHQSLDTWMRNIGSKIASLVGPTVLDLLLHIPIGHRLMCVLSHLSDIERFSKMANYQLQVKKNNLFL